MKKSMSLLMLVLLSFQLTGCNHASYKCENIAITNTAQKDACKENGEIKSNKIINFINKEDGGELFYKEATMEWDNIDKRRVSDAIDFLLEKTKDLNLNNPPTINFIKTNAYEEGGAADTRGEYIILTQEDLNNLSDDAMKSIVAHEFFHMYFRYNEDLKEDFYKAIKFNETVNLEYPIEIKELRISNPDAPITNYYIECDYKNNTYKFMPIIYASREFDNDYSDTFFEYLEDPLIAIEIVDGFAKPLYVDGKTLIVKKSDTDNFYSMTGENTYYALHPEEIMADNFAIYVLGEKPRSQWVIDGMLDVIKNNESIKN